MTREEEIREAALAYSFDTDGGAAGDLNTCRDDFIEGTMGGQTPAIIIRRCCKKPTFDRLCEK